MAEPSVHDLVRQHGQALAVAPFKAQHPWTYKVFIEHLEKNLAEVGAAIAQGKKFFHDKGEEELSYIIVMLLDQKGYASSAEPFNAGGHVDITVTAQSYRWLGEAKLDNGPTYIEGGLQQLMTRYTTGTEGDGGILIYVRKKNAKRILGNWKRHLEKRSCCGLKGFAKQPRPLTFRSRHKHASSGLLYRVLHIALPLHYDPLK